MGLWGASWRDEFEWLRLPDLPELPVPRSAGSELADRMRAYAGTHLRWAEGAGTRVFLVDLDNIRAEPARLRGRLALVAALAAAADVVVMAGQVGAVARARVWLGELGRGAIVVGPGADAADHALLEAVDALPPGAAQFVVASNDGIFAELALRGPLTVLSPKAGDLSGDLRRHAARVVDLTAVETAVGGGRAARG